MGTLESPAAGTEIESAVLLSPKSNCDTIMHKTVGVQVGCKFGLLNNEKFCGSGGANWFRTDQFTTPNFFLNFSGDFECLIIHQ